MSALRPGCEPRCPGCRHRELPVEQSVLKKQEWLARVLASWRDRTAAMRGLEGEERWGYRRKTCLRAEWRGTAWVFGMQVRRPGERRPEVIGIPDCPVHAPFTREVLRALSGVMPADWGLAYVMVAGEFLTLVLKEPSSADRIARAAMLLDWRALGLRGVWLNFHPSAGNRVLSARGWVRAWGEERACLKVLGQEVWYGPDTFAQQILPLWEDSLREAENFLGVKPGDRVLDLCSGIGVTLRQWIGSGASALGVELSGASVELAALNAPGASILRGKVSERLPQMSDWFRNGSGRTLLYANPPRLGLEAEVTRWIVEQARPERLVYLSCSAGTLARDLSILTEAGYRVERIIPYDFFPQTEHVETLACLEMDPARGVPGTLAPRSDSRPDG